MTLPESLLPPPALPAPLEADPPSNAWLRRLVLSSCGRLDASAGGKSVPIAAHGGVRAPGSPLLHRRLLPLGEPPAPAPATGRGPGQASGPHPERAPASEAA